MRKKESLIRFSCSLLNCAFAQDNGENVYLCTNEENKNTVKKRMLDAAAGVSEAYKVTDFDISPLPLKKVTGKCKQWVLNEEVLNSLAELFI